MDRLAADQTEQAKRDALPAAKAKRDAPGVCFTTRKQTKGPGQRYQLLLQPVLMQKQLVPLASGDQM